MAQRLGSTAALDSSLDDSTLDNSALESSNNDVLDQPLRANALGALRMLDSALATPLDALATHFRLLRDDGDASGDGASGDGASGDVSVPSVGDLWHTTLNGAFAFVVGCTFFWCVVQPIIVHCRRQSRGFDGGGPLL